NPSPDSGGKEARYLPQWRRRARGYGPLQSVQSLRPSEYSRVSCEQDGVDQERVHQNGNSFFNLSLTLKKRISSWNRKEGRPERCLQQSGLNKELLASFPLPERQVHFFL